MFWLCLLRILHVVFEQFFARTDVEVSEVELGARSLLEYGVSYASGALRHSQKAIIRGYPTKL